MKAYLSAVAAILLMSSVSMAQKGHTIIEGKIKNVLIGEMDPFVIGDVCLIDVLTSEGDKIALLTDFEECDEQDLKINRGLTVFLPLSGLVTEADKLEVLSEYSPAKKFYVVEYGAIENGLEDERDFPPHFGKVKHTYKTIFSCEQGDGDQWYRVGIAKTETSKTGYKLFVVLNNTDDDSKKLVLGKEVKVKNINNILTINDQNAKLSIAKDSHGFSGIFSLATKNNSVKKLSMDCYANDDITFDVTVVLEPRFSAGN